MDGVPSDVVELIIAVDLNPTDPEQPINVKDVKVGKEGEGEGGECGMCKRLLTAIAKITPELASVDDEGMSIDEAVRMVEDHADGAPEDAQDEADPFTKAKSMPMRHESRGFSGGSSFKKRRFDEDEED